MKKKKDNFLEFFWHHVEKNDLKNYIGIFLRENEYNKSNQSLLCCQNDTVN